MEESKYITFTSDDIIEALEDLYYKRTKEKIDVRFDEENKNISHIRGITFKKSISYKDDDVVESGISNVTISRSSRPSIVDYNDGEPGLVSKTREAFLP